MQTSRTDTAFQKTSDWLPLGLIALGLFLNWIKVPFGRSKSSGWVPATMCKSTFLSSLMMRVSLILVSMCALCSCGRPDHKAVNFGEPGFEIPVIVGDKTVARIFEVNGKQGLKDTVGNVLIPAKYDRIEEWAQFGLLRTDSGGHDASGYDYVAYEMGKIGLIDYKGNIFFHPQFDYLNFAWQPLGLVSKNGKYGYINTKGEIAIPLMYDSAGVFQNGFAVVRTSTGHGLINLRGELVIEPNQDHLFHGYATGFGKDTMLLIFEDYSSKMINNSGVIFDVVPGR